MDMDPTTYDSGPRTHPDHLEVAGVGHVSGPDQGLSALVLELPAVVAVQVDLQDLEVVVFGHADFANLHFCVFLFEKKVFLVQ